jgi:hypothetical protein
MEPTTKSLTEMGLTPLADYSRQELYIGRPALYLYSANGTKVDRDLAAMSIQLRLIEALEGTSGTSRLARLSVPSSKKGQFCEFIASLAQEWGSTTPFVEGVEDQPGIGAVVIVQYSKAEQLYYVGIRWEQKLQAQRQQGGHQS